MRLLYLIINLGISNVLFAQFKIIDSTIIQHLPVREGKIYGYEYPPMCDGCYYGIRIYTNTDSVFLLENGEVVSVFKMGDDNVAMIQNGKQFFIYSNLKNVFVKKGDQVQKGSYIGLLARRDDETGNILDFLIMKVKLTLPTNVTLKYILKNMD